MTEKEKETILKGLSDIAEYVIEGSKPMLVIRKLAELIKTVALMCE